MFPSYDFEFSRTDLEVHPTENARSRNRELPNMQKSEIFPELLQNRPNLSGFSELEKLRT